MSMIACVMPYTNGSYDEGNLVRCYPWRMGTNGVEIQAGGGDDGWVDAANAIPNDLTFKTFLFVEIEDSVDDDLYEYTGKQRGSFDWKMTFTGSIQGDIRNRRKFVPVQMGKGVNKADIGKGPDWGKPRGKSE